VGYIAGEILHIGPDYMSLAGSSSVVEDWISCWADHYQEESDLETLRWVNEEYTAKILDYEHTELARVCNMSHPYVSAWLNSEDRRDSPTSGLATEHGKLQASTVVENQSPRICLGTGYVMGLVPAAAILHDVIVRFWNCNAAIVMRPYETNSSRFMLVGRADVADVISGMGAGPSKDQASLPSWKSRPLPGSGTGTQQSGAVYVDLDLLTLQKITAHITT
jgi:hypothetical protein